ncbi:MAG: Nif3-like dinuclear metal center hexameric protein [Caulobacteraceae bacterium]
MGTIKCQTIANILEEIAPRKLAEEWDNVGLLVGNGKQTVRKLMVSLDVPEWVVEEAVENGVDMIVCHHPIIFNGIKRVSTDNSTGRKIINLIQNNISLYCMHTNYDIAAGGLNDIFTRQMGFKSFDVIEATYKEKLYKIVVFVPEGHEEKVMDAMCNAGAGFIGKYSRCTFRAKGTGTFEPQEGTKPFIGTKGKLESAAEFRLETIVPEKLLNKVTKEMLKAHPYEEVAYDIFETVNDGNVLGLGRLAELEKEIKLSQYAETVKNILGANHIRYAGDPEKAVKKVALLNGSGNKFVSDARFAGADVLVTGDMQYHQILDALEMGLCVIDAGHYATEKIMISSIAEYLRNRLSEQKYDVEVIKSNSNIDLLRLI